MTEIDLSTLIDQYYEEYTLLFVDIIQCTEPLYISVTLDVVSED